MSFTARYQTRCPVCDQQIHPGDDADWTDDDEVVHARCVDGTPGHTDHDPCPTCFMVPAANGACGCE